MEASRKMLKKIVGTITALSLAVGSMGMAYPQEQEEQDTAYLVYSEAVTSSMTQKLQAEGGSSQTIQTIQAQGASSVAKYAGEEARIQEAAMPLVQNTVESAKRKTTLTSDELLLLQKVVSAEARGESAEAQYTVACVVLNRLESDLFPDTLEEVVTQSGQFTCVESGAINNVPITDSVVSAVDLALDNNTVDADVLWFRSGCYHSFHNQAFSLGAMYFSEM